MQNQVHVWEGLIAMDWPALIFILVVVVAILGPVRSWLMGRKESLQDIVQSVVNDPEAITPELHARFWELAARSNTEADALVKSLAESHLPFYEYSCSYYRDALESLRTGKAVKSEERAACEQQLPGSEAEEWARKMEIEPPSFVSEGANSTRSFIARMDQEIELIALRRPVPGVGVYDEPTLYMTLGAFKSALEALQQLFTRHATFESQQ